MTSDAIDMLEVRLVANRLAGTKAHLSGQAVLEAVNEILRQRRAMFLLASCEHKYETIRQTIKDGKIDADICQCVKCGITRQMD